MLSNSLTFLISGWSRKNNTVWDGGGCEETLSASRCISWKSVCIDRETKGKGWFKVQNLYAFCFSSIFGLVVLSYVHSLVHFQIYIARNRIQQKNATPPI